MIIWLNGAFGSGKTTLTGELHRRLPDAVIFDPEYVGYVLTQAVPAPTGDFQDLPSWRHLVAEHALTLRRFHTATLIVPMTLVNRQYFDEIIGTLREAGEDVLHVFLDVPADILESRIRAQVICPGDPEQDEQPAVPPEEHRTLCRGSQGAARGHGHAAIRPDGPVTARGRGARSRRRVDSHRTQRPPA